MNGFPEVPFLGRISRSKAQTERLIGEWHRRGPRQALRLRTAGPRSGCAGGRDRCPS